MTVSRRGGELEQIQFLLGHASVQTTERYIGCKQDLARAVNDRLPLRPGALRLLASRRYCEGDFAIGLPRKPFSARTRTVTKRTAIHPNGPVRKLGADPNPRNPTGWRKRALGFGLANRAIAKLE